MAVKMKICGLSRKEDISYANALKPDFIGFVFAKKSRRYVDPEKAAQLRRLLDPGIIPVGVFVNEDPKQVADLLKQGIIEIAQLHGQEDETYLLKLKKRTDKPLIQAFQIDGAEDVKREAYDLLAKLRPAITASDGTLVEALLEKSAAIRRTPTAAVTNNVTPAGGGDVRFYRIVKP